MLSPKLRYPAEQGGYSAPPHPSLHLLPSAVSLPRNQTKPDVHYTPPAFLCSSDSTYQACVAACEPPETCQDGIFGPLDPEQCQVLGEGCVCSEGTILHRRHSSLCIPEDKCGRSLPSPGGSPKPSLPLVPPLLPKDHGGGHFALPGLGLGVVHVWMRGIIAETVWSLVPVPKYTPTAACTDSTGVPRALGETWNSSLSGCCQQQCQAPDTIIPVDLDCPGPRPESCPRFGEVVLLQPTEDPCCLGSVCGESHS